MSLFETSKQMDIIYSNLKLYISYVVCVCVCIYIYIYLKMLSEYIYIYIYVELYVHIGLLETFGNIF